MKRYFISLSARQLYPGHLNVEEHHGSVGFGFDSTPGKGSSFYFELPCVYSRTG